VRLAYEPLCAGAIRSANGEAVDLAKRSLEHMAWYAIHVRTGREDAVCEEIRKQAALVGYSAEFELLVPKRKLQERRQGEFVEVIRTMFPGYVLVQSEDIRGIAEVTRRGKGIIRFLQNEDDFQEIRLEEISMIVYMTDEAGVIGVSEALVEGNMIQVVSGPLKGHEGLIKKIDKHHRRAKVEFWLDGRRRLIDLAVEVH
jgi:transcriptional antiterminator NusG